MYKGIRMAWKDDDFSTLFELLPIGVYRTDPGSRQLRANKALVRIFGFKSEAEMLANAKASAEGWYVDPKRREQFRAQLERSGSLRDFVSEMRRHGTGETFWISENAHLVRDAKGKVLYHEGTVEDITDRVRAQQALKLMLDNAGRGITKVDAQGRVVLYNRALLEVLDLPQELLARQPHIDEVIRFQVARGDFIVDGEPALDREIEALTKLADTVSSVDLHATAGRYLRRTRTGKIIEVSTQKLPDGGIVRTFSDVTAYVDAQRALGEKTRALRIALDNMEQGIAAFDAEDRIVMTNRRFQELLGFKEDLLATKPTLEQLLHLQMARGDFGEDFGAVDAAARHYVANNIKPIQGPVTYMRRTPDGRTLEILTRPLPDGGVVRTYTDMTDHVAAQDALARKEAQLRAVVSNIPDRVWLKDIDGVYLMSNPAHWRHFGKREQDFVGRTAHEVFGKQFGDRQRVTDLKAMGMDQPLLFEEERAEGGPGARHVEVVKVAIRDESGACLGLLGIARDITQRKRAEEALIASKEAAQAAEQAKVEFLANVSQEIRAPIEEVVGTSESLIATRLDARQRELADKIRARSSDLRTFVEGILDLSKMESGNLVLDRTSVDLLDCVEGVLESLGAAAAAKGVELACHVRQGVPAAIVGDPARLRQVFMNLVGNAVKFTNQGEVVVTLESREAADARAMLHATVRDTGIGIAAERVEKLFHATGSTALGLAISRRLLELMGGRIWVESTQGAGSSFHFELPLQAAPELQPFKPSPTLAGRAVLVAAANASQRDMLAARIARFGMRVFTAASAADARVRFRETSVDVAVIDGLPLAEEIDRMIAAMKMATLVIAPPGPGWQVARGPHERVLPKPARLRALHDALLSFFETPAPPAEPPRALVMKLEPEARREIVALFSQEAPRLHRELHRAFEQHDAKAVLIAAHTLAGSAGYFDAQMLRQVCRSIEAAADANDLGAVQLLLSSFDEGVTSALIEAAKLADVP
jgi:PAS domain S-box-containing protein